MQTAPDTRYTWLKNGDEAFARMLEAIDASTDSIHLETYTFRESVLGERFRDGLVRAARRGVRVQVLIDFLGSGSLRSSFWDPLLEAGGQFRWFNPWNPWLLGIRNHRKIMTCDRQRAFIGGFNIAPDYEGDGITKGWRDLGMEIHGTLAGELATAVEDSFSRADLKHKRMQRFRRSPFNRQVRRNDWTLLLSGPGRGRKYLKQALGDDMRRARSIRIMCAYFLPTWRIRRELLQAARRGARVQLILPGESDVAISKLAGRCLYRPLLTAGVEIYEYQPQILHAKLFLMDNLAYAGSANLDTRSLNINYELLVRMENAAVTREAEDLFEADLQRCRRIKLETWRQGRPFWKRWFEHWAFYALARLDPYLARLNARDVP